ncbi:MAG: RNA polymerase sigma factor FliA [Acidithiobacillus sp.]
MIAQRAWDQDPHRSAQVARYVPLVQRIAQRLRARLPANVDLGDLIQAGLIGLLDVLEQYPEPDDSESFMRYATLRIRGSMLDELREQDWLPRRARAKEQQVSRTMAQLEQELGRPPSDQEVARSLGWDLDDYQKTIADSGGQLMYLEDLATDNDAFVGQYLRDHGADISEVLGSVEFDRYLQAAIARLPEREQLVLSLYYREELTLREIGDVLEVTESRVSQILRQAVLRLRAAMHAGAIT